MYLSLSIPLISRRSLNMFKKIGAEQSTEWAALGATEAAVDWAGGRLSRRRKRRPTNRATERPSCCCCCCRCRELLLHNIRSRESRARLNNQSVSGEKIKVEGRQGNWRKTGKEGKCKFCIFYSSPGQERLYIGGSCVNVGSLVCFCIYIRKPLLAMSSWDFEQGRRKS